MKRKFTTSLPPTDFGNGHSKQKLAFPLSLFLLKSFAAKLSTEVREEEKEEGKSWQK